MSQPISRLLYPLEGTGRPSFEPEVEQAILASWMCDRSPASNRRAQRKRSGVTGRLAAAGARGARAPGEEPGNGEAPLQ